METILEVDGLTKQYPGFNLKDISFTLERGYIMGLIGPNGAGKSTTLRIIMNLIHADSGSVRIFGKEMATNEKMLKEKIGFVYDELYYYGILTVMGMKNIIAPFYSAWNDSLFMDYLNRFDIDPQKKIDDLSRGMKTKLALAVALSHGAELILMDEPTSGLDPVFRSDLLDVLYEIIQSGKVSILFSTHITTDLERIADYITFVNRGSMVFSETKDRVLEAYTIVRGPVDLIDKDVESLFIGLKHSGAMFEGLTCRAQEVKRFFGDKAIIESAALDEIMLYTVKGRNYAETGV